MNVQSVIAEALKLFKDGKATRVQCRIICANLGFLLRNNELGKTQIPVVYYILGGCNEQLGNYWGAARAFKKVSSLIDYASERQLKYADIFITEFIKRTDKKILWHEEEVERLRSRRTRIQK